HKLLVGPERALVQKQAPIPFPDEARGPGLRRPGGIQLPLQEKSELIGIGEREYLNIATLVRRLQSVRLHPRAQRDVLRVPQLGRGDLLAVKVAWTLNPGVVADDYRCATPGCAGDDPERFAIGSHVAGDGGIRADVGHVERTRKERFDCGWTSVERLPVDLYARAHGLFELTVRFDDHRLGMRDVRKRAYPNRDRRLCSGRPGGQYHTDRERYEVSGHRLGL